VPPKEPAFLDIEVVERMRGESIAQASSPPKGDQS